MQKIEVLVGMIASGKSTYTTRRAQDGAVIVNDDSIVTAIHGGNYTLYKDSLKPLYKSVESHIIIQALLLGQDVVIDRPNYRISTRQRYIGIAKMMDVDCIGVIFDKQPADVHAQRRFRSDPRGHTIQYWTMVAQEHEANWEYATQEEGFDGVEILCWKN
jgi:predicted kinase